MAINLLPWREALYQQKKIIFLSTFFIALACILIAFLGIKVTLSYKKKQIIHYSQWLSKQIESLKEKQNVRHKKTLRDEKHAQQLKWVSNKLKEEKNKALFLIKMKEINLKTIQLNQLKFEKNQFHLKGKSLSISNILNFINSLKALPMISQIHLVEAGKPQEKTTVHSKKSRPLFTLKIMLK